jgi:prepilin-type processing-associated H-X9-DG protein
MLAGILFPVFAGAREKARQTSCLSNERQLGLAILQYVQDHDELFPNGFDRGNDERVWPGQGWAGQCRAYIKDPGVFRCPSDPTASAPPGDYAVSYGYNINFVEWGGDRPPSGMALASLTAPARSVLLFEVAGVCANVTDDHEGARPGGTQGRHFSSSANGLDNRLYAQKVWATHIENQYATGYLGGRLPPDPRATQFERVDGRHADGSNFLLADGHARWFRGADVSSGRNAEAENCSQDKQPPVAGCSGPILPSGALLAAGTGTGVSTVRATFSTK